MVEKRYFGNFRISIIVIMNCRQFGQKSRCTCCLILLTATTCKGFCRKPRCSIVREFLSIFRCVYVRSHFSATRVHTPESFIVGSDGYCIIWNYWFDNAKTVDHLTFTLCGMPQCMTQTIVEAKSKAKIIVILSLRSSDCNTKFAQVISLSVTSRLWSWDWCEVSFGVTLYEVLICHLPFDAIPW